jgi:hypothetical protein
MGKLEGVSIGRFARLFCQSPDQPSTRDCMKLIFQSKEQAVVIGSYN